MMNHIAKYIVLCLMMALYSSCAGIKETHETLENIETYMNNRPDSALSVLQSIVPAQLYTKSLRTYHGLLLTQAKDKCYIDETDDSLMQAVVKYYSRRNDIDKLFRSYYYLGRIQCNAGDYTNAMFSYMEAEQLSEKIDNDFFKGLLNAQMGVLHEIRYDYPRAFQSFSKAYDYYSAAGKIAHKYYAKADMGHMCLVQNDFENAEIYLNEVHDWIRESNDPYISDYCIELLCMLYEASGNDEALDALLNEYSSEEYSYLMFLNLMCAYKCAQLNDLQKSDEFIERAWTLSSDINDTVNIYNKQYLIYKSLGLYREALECNEIMFNIEDTLLRATLKHPLLAVQSEYYHAKAENNELRAEKQRVIFWGILGLVVLIVVFIVIQFRNRLIIKDNEIGRYIELSTDFEQTLYTKNHRIDEMLEHVAELFARQYSLLDKLTNIYYETHGSRRDKDAIYSQVKKELENFSTDKKSIKQLEKIVNQYKGNVMSLVRSNMPQLSEMDYRMLSFMFAGFSAKAISIFTGDSIGNIYTKKSRIKNEIYTLSPEVSSQIMQYWV